MEKRPKNHIASRMIDAIVHSGSMPAMRLKNFTEWMTLKSKLHAKEHAPPYVAEGEIWWANIGQNVGAEIDGKSNLFSRPVIILKKLSRAFYLVVPTTSQERKGSWYASFQQRGISMTACLHQVRTIAYRRLSSLLGTLDDNDLLMVRRRFQSLYTINSPPLLAGPWENPKSEPRITQDK